MPTDFLPTPLRDALASLPAGLRAPVHAAADPVISDMWARPPSIRWTADRGAIPGEPVYYLDVPADPSVPLEATRFVIVVEEVEGEAGEVYGLYYLISDGEGGTGLGRYADLKTCAAAAEWIADHLPLELRAALRV